MMLLKQEHPRISRIQMKRDYIFQMFDIMIVPQTTQKNVLDCKIK